jgi:hypothetical protein
LKQFCVPVDNVVDSSPVGTVDIYVVTVFGEQTTEAGHVMAVPRNCVFGQNVTHSSFIVVSVLHAAAIAPRRLGICISIVTIPVSVTGVVGRIEHSEY